MKLSATIKPVNVQMYHPHLSETPVFACPDAFRIEPYKAGREQDWLRIHKDADLYNEFPDSIFRQQFGPNQDVIASRQLYLVQPDDTAVGTASAWFNNSDEKGRVHWVAISTQFHGLGLAKPLLSAVCQKLIALGHKDATLSTSTVRVPAINLYLRFGFEPLIITESDEEAWRMFFQTVGSWAQ